jgi:MarR family transcriptional regulator, negative regulator of the multidrug operon emrRAB
MNEPSERLINLFGALALGVTDRVRWAALAETALGGETAAALVVIGHSPGLSIDRLSQVLRLSHPGTVRLVDRLTAADLAVRSMAPHDRRVAVLSLTKAGQVHRIALLERRRKALEAVLNEVAPEDRAALERLTEAMLRRLPKDATSALTVCRFCNNQLCLDCPMDAFGAVC